MSDKKDESRTGYVTFVGRPNTGKSTLLNALVCNPVTAVSSRPQTTRRAVRALINLPTAQLIVVDTPGLHRPRTVLGERLNELVHSTLNTVDTALACFPADQKPGPGDRYLVSRLEEYPNVEKIAVLTKCDLVNRSTVEQRLIALDQLYPGWKAIVPVSARSGERLDVLLKVIVSTLPEHPYYFPETRSSEAQTGASSSPVADSSEKQVADLIRESALQEVKEELPHSIAVLVEEIIWKTRRNKPLAEVYASLYVERPSQKGIVIGAQGSRLRTIGERARSEIEKLLDCQAHLSIKVRVAKNWQNDPKLLQRLGF